MNRLRISRLGNEISAAFGLLTRLPVGRFSASDPVLDYANCVWAYPVVGIAVGALGGGVFWIADALGMSPLLAACWTLAALVLATGGLHEDGLADTADGFGGGATRERKLEILRDSRIGTFGTLALVLSLGIRASAIAAIGSPAGITAAMIVAGALGRGAVIGLLLALKPARPNGLSASLDPVPPGSAAAGLAIALLTAAILLSPQLSLAVLVLALAGTLAMAVLTHRQIGGHTGDVLGATEIIVECVVLSALAL